MFYKHLKRGAFVVFGVIISIVIIEGLLRFGGWEISYFQEKQNKKDLINLTNRKKIVILCVGDSTTAEQYFFGGGENSWPNQLQIILKNNQQEKIFHVINKAVPGVNTSYLLQRFEDNLNAYKPSIVLAMVGFNDKPKILSKIS